MGVGKQQMRLQALAARRALGAGAVEAAGQALLDAVRERRPGRVAAYASTGTEPGTLPLLRAVPGVLLPVLLPDGDLDWAVFEGELVPGPRGTVEPPGPRLGRDAVADCDLVVVPALGVDRAGTRLGRGGGSYDRALVRATGLVVALLHPGELHGTLPREPHDRPVDAAVLPGTGLVDLRPTEEER